MGDILAGSRLMRGFIRLGGVAVDLPSDGTNELLKQAAQLRIDLRPVLEFFFDNQVAIDRMEAVGRVSLSLARDFGLVGVAGRACGLDYDCRRSWPHGVFPKSDLNVITDPSGDVLARARVRVAEIQTSLETVHGLLSQLESGHFLMDMPKQLPPNCTAAGIVESHRGELIHMLITNAHGKISRYCIKDPSVNNWTGLAIAVRNNLVADFPLCNKSFSLSYSGHDL